MVFFFFSWIRIKKVNNHDGVLFPFCQLRRDIISFLYENVFENPGALTHKEYMSVRRLLDMLNGAIRNYNEHKVQMFNVRKVVKYLDQHSDTLAKVTPPEVTNNSQIKEFHSRFVYCFAKAFLAYTPLIRSQATVFILVLLARVVYRAGPQAVIQKLKSDAQKMRDAAGHAVASV